LPGDRTEKRRRRDDDQGGVIQSGYLLAAGAAVDSWRTPELGLICRRPSRNTWAIDEWPANSLQIRRARPPGAYNPRVRPLRLNIANKRSQPWNRRYPRFRVRPCSSTIRHPRRDHAPCLPGWREEIRHRRPAATTIVG
jgi:hypothetical protein